MRQPRVSYQIVSGGEKHIPLSYSSYRSLKDGDSMYGIEIRRELHMHPELRFDLPYTLGVVRRELNRFGIPFSEAYGRSSIVATLAEDQPGKALAIRADMDALPIAEANCVPYKSLNEGKMHACGHDVHTAVLLDTARKLSAFRTRLNRPVMLIFQAAEESGGGARLMAEDGVLRDVEEIVSLHVNAEEVGTAYFMDGPCNAACALLKLDFTGKSAHSSMQASGRDAILMAVHALSAIESYLAKCFQAGSVVLFNAGKIEGGTAGNIIAEHCTVSCHARSWEDGLLDRLIEAVGTITKNTAEMFGGTGVMTVSGKTPVLVQDPGVTSRLRKAAEEILGKENVHDMKRVMASEDFAEFARQIPATMMRLGCGNQEKGIVHSVHTPRFDIDERAIDKGSDIFVRYLTNRMGIT